MPGLSQLKKFNADILSLGNEPALRASRGEKPVTVPIPKGTKDINDADDFVMGMPEPVEPAKVDKALDNGPEDFSDIMGTSSSSVSNETASDSLQAGPQISLSVPDLSSLAAFDSDQGNEPDLSMFDEPVQEDLPEAEPEPEKEPEMSELSLEDLLGGAGFDGSEGAAEFSEEENTEDLLVPEEIPPVEEAEVLPEPEDFPEAEPFETEQTSEAAATTDFSDSFDYPDVSSNETNIPDISTEEFSMPEGFEADGFETVNPEAVPDEENADVQGLETADSLENPDTTENFKDSDFSDIAGLDLDAPDFAAGQEEISDTENNISPEAEAVNDEFAFDGSAIDMGEGLPDSITEADSVPKNEESAASGEDDFGLPSGLFNAADMDLPDMPDEESAAFTEASADENAENTETEAVSEEVPEEAVSSDVSESPDFKDEDFPSDFNFNLDDNDGDSSEAGDAFESPVPSETFDTSEMEGLDFGIPDTDAAIESGNFELGNSDDFADENSDFEIPGFSDVDTVEVNKNGKIKVPVEEEEVPDENGDLPPNTLSDEQYEKFIKNLSTYPLNVRMAVEELIVKNEFTDEAEFGIVQKVIKKVSARALASELEKMLDIAIPVPRDFERRTAEEYEAYKASFQYQLSNKIIPGAIVSVAALIICFFLFQFTRYFIYRPARANALYSQGYKFLEAEDYPQSEIRFTEATKYQLMKKWFFRYAHGYREHKQYIRAEQMYKNILYCFKHDKTAGLEYAEMEMKDLANYEKTEEIILRDILDYHINDADAILLLGDNYLEWAEEKDPSKFDEAHKRYAELIQLYGSVDKFMARMMRYHIRTDNLKEVLTSKERFYPRPKSLEPEDWTELSGYCLDKLYGKLSPSDEYLRTKIEDVKEMLVRSVKMDGNNPLAYYNLARYYINTNNTKNAERSLVQSLKAFEKINVFRKKDIYKNIDGYRLLGELYTNDKDYLKALEAFTNGITLYTNARDGSGLEGNSQVGNLYADMGDIEFFIAGDYENALHDYQDAVDVNYDNGKIRYKIGYIQYSKENYAEAIGSFMKASEDYADDQNLLLAMGNTLSLRNDNFAALGYYERLLEQIDSYRMQHGILFPQVKKDEAEIVDSYMKSSNNLGVTLYRLARRTGSSAMNAKAMVKFQDSLRAWDSMTRNQQSMVRLSGSNLAEQNLKYVTHPMPDFEPAIYTELPRTLTVEKGLK